jgi:hypothetical protein
MEIKTSLIDWIGEMEGGVAVLIGITLNDIKTIDGVYWTHPDGRRGIKLEHIFLRYLRVQREEDIPFIEDLLNDIESILPPKEEIFKQFLEESN